MSADFQTLAALILVALAATWLVARSVRKRGNSGCGGGCGCPTEKLKR